MIEFFKSLGSISQTAIPIIVMLAVLIWGLRLIAKSAKDDAEESETLQFSGFLREKSPDSSRALLRSLANREGFDASTVTPEQIAALKNELQQDISFSRVAGAIGAVSMAAFFAGLGVWCFFAINDTKLYPAEGAPATQIYLISRISELGTFIAAGAALFLPYAFNRISAIFR